MTGASVGPGAALAARAWRVPAFIAAVVLAACAAPRPMPKELPATPPPLDASYDWHVLLLAPFGNVVKELPFTLHEVLLFKDREHGGIVDDAECYATDQSLRPFLERVPDEYLMCFRHDHLSRVEASVSLPADKAPDIFAAACGLWRRNAAAGRDAAIAGDAAVGDEPGTSGLVAAAADGAGGATGAEDRDAGSVCKGRDGAINFDARLGRAEQSATRVSIKLDVADPP